MDKEEHGSPVASLGGAVEMEFDADDCRRAFSSILHEEKLLEKKKRWLMSTMKTGSTNKRPRYSEVFENVCLSESFVRSDDVGLQDIRMFVERCFRSSAEKKRFDRTLPKVGGTNEGSSPESLKQSQFGDHFERVDMLSQILNHLSSLNPTSSSLVSSISKILEGLEALPSLALVTMDRKLKDVAFTPQFPVTFSCKRNVLIDQLRNRCYKILLTIREGSQLPNSLAKALSVMFLSAKQITRRADVMSTKLYPFTPEIENMQNEILKAIWSLPNIKRHKLEQLQYVIAPNVNLASKSLCRAIHKYLMEYLFHCDEQYPPKSFLMVLKLLNKEAGCQLPGEVTEEVEAILNVSSHLRQVVWDLFPDEGMDQEFANASVGGLGANGSDCDVIINENEDCSTFGYSDYLQICERADEVEGTGETTPVVSNLRFNLDDYSSAELLEGRQVSCNMKDESDQNGSSTESSHQPSSTNMLNPYLALQNICDETSLVAYKLLGHLLEELVQNESKKVGEATELSLRGDASSMPNCQDLDVARVLSENLQSAILEVIDERVFSLPNSVKRVKELTRLL